MYNFVVVIADIWPEQPLPAVTALSHITIVVEFVIAWHHQYLSEVLRSPVPEFLLRCNYVS